MWYLIAWKFVKKNFVPIIIFGALLTLGVKYHSMRITIEKQRSALLEYEVDMTRLKKERNDLINQVNQQNSLIMEMYQRSRDYEMEIERLKMQRPEKVTEYRDVVKEVEKIVVSPECVEAIKEAASIIKELKSNED